MMNYKKCSGVRSTILQLLLAVSLLQLGTLPDSNPVRVDRRSDLVRSVRMGANSAFTQTQSLTPPVFVHPKNVDAFYADPIFAELHELGIPSLLRRVRTRVFAYLAEDPGLPSTKVSSEAATASTGPQAGDREASPTSSTTSSDTLEFPGSTGNLTQEDMDLIEILWKQDEDLGVSRDIFDFHLGVEDSSEAAIKEQLENTEVPKQETDISSDQLEDSNPWEGFQYSIDSETGEHILVDNARKLDTPESSRERTDSGCFLMEEDTSFSLPDEDTSALFAQLDRILQGQPPQAADLYPVEDCWGSEEPRHEDSRGLQSLSAGGPPPHNYTDPFPGVLLHNATLGPPPMDQAAHFLQGASAFGATACTGPPCNNGSLPGDGVTYGQDFPDYLYPPGPNISSFGSLGSLGGMVGMPGMTNITGPMTANVQNDYLLTDFLGDEDLQLMDMVASPTEAGMGPYPVQLSVAEDRMDNSSDTGVSSMGSERVPSISEDHEWLDSCSESSSSHAEGDGGEACRFLGGAQKKYKLYGRRPAGPGDNDSVPLNGYPVQQQPFLRPLRRLPGGATLAVVPKPGPVTPFPSPVLNGRSLQPVEALVQHNHTYSAAEAATASTSEECNSSDEDEEEIEGEETELQRQLRASRDEKRARALNLPMDNAEIVELPIDEFNERLAKFELTDAQLALIRDIRRRGKNKVAAQNCRKRKLDQIMTLQQDVEALHLERQELERRHEELLAQHLLGRDKYSRLCQLLAAHSARPLNPNSVMPGMDSTALSITPQAASGAEVLKGARLKKKAVMKWEANQ